MLFMMLKVMHSLLKSVLRKIILLRAILLLILKYHGVYKIQTKLLLLISFKILRILSWKIELLVQKVMVSGSISHLHHSELTITQVFAHSNKLFKHLITMLLTHVKEMDSSKFLPITQESLLVVPLTSMLLHLITTRHKLLKLEVSDHGKIEVMEPHSIELET